MAYLHRKFIDLIRTTSSKYTNWDALHEVKVGSYGQLDIDTGKLCIEGNIYDPEFQQELDKHDLNMKMSDFAPQEGPVEDDLIITSRGAKRKDWDTDKHADLPGIANSPFKGKWGLERLDKREAILIMHRPRKVTIPPNVVLEPLYKVDKLYEKCLVISIYTCPAYAMYLSDQSFESTSNTVSLALVSQTSDTSATGGTADASGELTWWTDNPGGVFRHGYDQEGKYAFTALADMRRPIKRIRRFFRDKIRPEPEGDELWYFETPPWDPVDEDGNEDPLDPEVMAIDPFAHVEEAYRLKKLEEQLAAASLSQGAST